MKPEKLIICGWGPYKEKTVIDFNQLNTSGLFLITGQTGAGKTTIFDATAYALYGVLSGEVREKGSVRSDFADADTPTYVELFLNHKNESYHISRNPEYQRPKKRKSGENAFTKEKENAVLTMPDGTIIAGNQDVTAKVEEILGMDSRQFRQISMIAQGEFSKMLFASPTDKNTIFRELFGTGIYARIQERLSIKSKELYKEYMIFRNKMEEDMHLLSFEDEEWTKLSLSENPDFEQIELCLLKKIEQEKKNASLQRQSEKKLEEELFALQKELEAVKQQNSRFDELEKTGQKLEKLQEKKLLMIELEARISNLEKARVLYPEEKLVIEKEQLMTKASLHMKQLETEVSSVKEQLQSLNMTAEKKDTISQAFYCAEQLKEMQKLQKKTEDSLKQIRESLVKARNVYQISQQQAEEKRRQYEEADVRYKKAVIGIAARLVKEGEPCPVCGSLHHPHIAAVSDDVPDERQLELWKEEADKSREECERCYEQALSLVNEEKNCEKEAENYKLQSNELSQALEVFSPDILSYIREHTKQEFERTLNLCLETAAILAEKEKQLVLSCRDAEQKQKEAEEARRNLEDNLIKNGFDDFEAYKRAISDLGTLEEKKREFRNYQDNLLSLQKLYEHLKNSLKGLSKRNEAPLMECFLQKQTERKECRRLSEETGVLLNQIQRSYQGICKNRIRAEEIKKEYGLVKDLDNLANGNNARKLVFEQFVLAGYFEKILKAANLRLDSMTDGRYELQRATQVSDGRKKDNLEILVMDYYTGRKRPVKTLSGGEIFKASLALALGMSDCIQAENGGMEVETLFIDEGFGALDEESLEQACNTLQTLAGGNRMIGIISHVASLCERIDHQIVIEKRNNGSSVRII